MIRLLVSGSFPLLITRYDTTGEQIIPSPDNMLRYYWRKIRDLHSASWLNLCALKEGQQISKIAADDNQKDTDQYRQAARANRCCRQSAVRDTLLPVSLARSLRQQQNLVVVWQRVDCCVGYGRTMLTPTPARDACGLSFRGLCWRLGYREVGYRCSLQGGHSCFRLCSSTTKENVFTGRDVTRAENLFTRHCVTSDENLFIQFSGNI